MTDIRVPVQKRSIEKKQRILDIGFELFCEKGYSKTNTIEIAKRAGVSTGSVYCYFKDKRQIYIAAFQGYLENMSKQLFEKLEAQQPYQLSDFVKNWITLYLGIYNTAGHNLAQLKMMILEDEKINRHFSELENKYFFRIVNILSKNNIAPQNAFEKVYISCILIDTLRQETSCFFHSGLDFEILKLQVTEAIIKLLDNPCP